VRRPRLHTMVYLVIGLDVLVAGYVLGQARARYVTRNRWPAFTDLELEDLEHLLSSVSPQRDSEVRATVPAYT
jgi:hypothetical protein